MRLTYVWRHRRVLNLGRPRRFTELVQHRKLHDRNPLFPLLADKVAVKAFVTERIGAAWVIPTLWVGAVLPDRVEWPMPFVVKARHGCNQNAFVIDERADWLTIKAAARRWMQSAYGTALDEWLYSAIPRGLLVEAFVGTPGTLPIDYKFYVFGGRVEFVQVHLDRTGQHRWVLLDRAWHRVSAASADADPTPPATLERMIAAAEALGRDIDFVRVDLYEIDETPLFGEMTFYPGSGLDRFDPPSLDPILGAKWLDARGG